MNTPDTRYEFLDWLRVLAIFLLLFFHTGMLFVGWGWHITNDETIPALVWPMDLAHRLRMPLLQGPAEHQEKLRAGLSASGLL